MTDDPDRGHEPRCEAELTEIRTRDQDWWSLGLEATGPADLLRRALEATAGLVFAQALPGGTPPGPRECRSYAEWLGQLGIWASPRICVSYFRMLTARAITSAPMPSDTHASTIMRSLAHGLIADVSVGLNAVAVQKARDR